MSLKLRLTKDLRDSWQARCLAETKGKTTAVVLAILFHNFPDAMPVLLRVVWPGFRDITRPFLMGGAVITRHGRVTCQMMPKDSNIAVWKVVYETEGELIKEFRDLADRLKLSDQERVDMTDALRKWVVADLRINHMGEKAA